MKVLDARHKGLYDPKSGVVLSRMEPILKQNPDFAFRKIIDGHAVLIPVRANPMEDNRLYSLNPTGARCWQLINGKRTSGDIQRTIAEEFDQPLSAIKKDTAPFFENLSEIGAIQQEGK